MNKEEFFKLLEDSIKDSIQRYYRNVVFIHDKDYLFYVREVLELYLKINPNPRTAYAFHPWVTGSKDRLNEIRKIVDVIDIDYSSSEKYLGSTFDVVILDLVDNFEPNFIGRLVDLVRGGGIAILYTDDLKEHKLFRNSIMRNGKIRDIYEERFMRKLREHAGIFAIINSDYYANPFKGEVGEKPSPAVPRRPLMPLELHKLCMSKDQNHILESFYTLRQGNKRVLVITSARGRGKSAVTGLGIAGLIHKYGDRKRKMRIVVTSPSSTGISQLMLFLKKGLDALSIPYKTKDSIYGYPMSIEGPNFKVYYEIPEATLEDEGDILVVDEAAAIGVGYIDSALKTWKKVVLVTTVHGYEGSGKAFLRYLRRILEARKFAVTWQEMTKPLRYVEGDPIEKWLYDTLLLDAEPEKPPRDISHLVFETASQEEIFSDDKKLRQIYGILVTAHYRNNPNDLMIMADGIHHKIMTLSTPDDKYVGVVQIAEEGGLPDSMIDLALKGGTFDGDLIPDRLIKHSRLREFGRMKGWRIVRIAIMQELQDMGLGSTMLKMITEEAKGQVDWVGSAFMGDIRVLNFWIKNGFIPVHVSPKRNEKLGDYPVVVMKPISELAKEAVDIASYILKEKMLNTIHDIYFSMDPEVTRIILRGIKVHKDVHVNKILIDKALAFIQGVSPYESSADGIHMLTLKYFWDAKRDWSLSPEQEIILIAKVLQGRPWRFTSSSLSANRTTVNELLYEAIAELLFRYYGLTPDSKAGLEIKNLDDEFHTNEL